MIELLKNNKLVTKSLQEWFTDRMKQAIKNNKMSMELGNNFLDIVISVEKLAPIIKINPRSLFDFFDEHQIYILPIMDKNKNVFSATINGKVIEGLVGFTFTRILAETEAVKLAFPLLEQKLATYEK